MDNIWDRNPLKWEVIPGRSGWDEKPRMTMQNRQKSNAKKTQNVKKNKKTSDTLFYILACNLLSCQLLQQGQKPRELMCYLFIFFL